MRDKLLWRLLGAQLLVIAIAVAISGALIMDRAAQFFMVIMTRYHIDPTVVEQDFVHAVQSVLVAGSVAAAAVAMLLGWILVRRLVRPISDMMLLAERIAAGDYAQRVATRGPDELVRLADSLNRMAASLERVESLRRDLVANVAHELRTPLSTLQGYLEGLRDGVVPVSRETLASLHEEVLRLVRLVDTLQQLSRFDARMSGLQRTRFDAGVLAQQIAALYHPELSVRNLRVTVVPGTPRPEVEADADLVGQALRNLLDNALRYASAGTDIIVRAAAFDGGVRLAVENTGERIAPDDLPHIFERFYRGEKSRSRDTGGAGIGLALVQEIARAHGGDAGAESAHGRTIVWLTLSTTGH
ncbi:MAG TPA: ATP-binding protein [bacterium]|nr:ATP-binding protein [bacterium]